MSGKPELIQVQGYSFFLILLFFLIPEQIILSTIIKLKNITHSYNGKDPVLKNINLDIPEKSFFSILGPSGCGKSTLLKIAASMIIPSEGNIYIKGSSADQPDPDRIIVLQDDNQLFPWKTVEQNVSFPQKILKRKSIRAKTGLLLKNVYLNDYKNYYPGELSGGMKKRAIIARALSSDPEILLLDEPFSSLDIQTRTSLHKLVYSIWEKSGITVVFVTHDIDEALSLSTDIAVMNSSGNFTSVFKSSFSGCFGNLSESFFKERQKLMNMIDSP